MKKWLTFLLLLITLAGTFYPCCLVDECNDEDITTAQKENKREENKQAADGTCSPLFPCANCPGFTEITKPFQIVQPLIENQAHHETLMLFNLSTYASSFWQPPRYC